MHENDGLMIEDSDEIDEILAALRRFMDRVSSPVVRACLEDTCDDIIHLLDKDIGPTNDVDLSEAA